MLDQQGVNSKEIVCTFIFARILFPSDQFVVYIRGKLLELLPCEACQLLPCCCSRVGRCCTTVGQLSAINKEHNARRTLGEIRGQVLAEFVKMGPRDDAWVDGGHSGCGVALVDRAI